MVDFYIYDNITGEILSIGNAPEDMVSLQLVGDNESIGLGTVDPETQYFDLDTETVKPKEVFNIMESGEASLGTLYSFSNIPEDTTVNVNGVFIDLGNETEISLELNTIGETRVMFTNVKYITKEVSLDVN